MHHFTPRSRFKSQPLSFVTLSDPSFIRLSLSFWCFVEVIVGVNHPDTDLRRIL
jgi:hypothetical protein